MKRPNQVRISTTVSFLMTMLLMGIHTTSQGKDEPDPDFVPTAPVKNQPNSSDYNAAGVKVGVFDSGFDGDSKRQRKKSGLQSSASAVAPRLIEVLSLADREPGVHGSRASRVIGGRNLGDGFPAGAAHGFDLYQAHQPIFPTAQNIRVNLEQLAARGVKIVNNSWSIPETLAMPLPAKAVELAAAEGIKQHLDTFSDAVNRDGQLLIWSSGNEGQPNPYFTAAAPYLRPNLEKGWLTVTLMKNGKFIDKANACGIAANWCLAADVPHNWLATSFAAPVVTAAAAQVAQVFPWMSNSELRQTILSTADDLQQPQFTGWGKLNSDKAVRGPGLFDTRLTLGGDFQADTKGQNAHFYNDIGGNAGLHKSGAGTLALWGNNTYTGDSFVVLGKLAIYGTQQSGVSVGSKGTLTADGGFIRGTVKNAGLVDSRGVGMRIGGDYVTLRKTATLVTQLGAPMNVGGKASLNSSTLIIGKPDDRYVVKASEPVLIADAVVGTFGAVRGEAGLLYSVKARYSAKQVDVDVVRTNVKLLADDLYPGHTARINAAVAVENAFQQADTQASGRGANVSQEFVDSAAKLQGETSITALGASLDSFSGQIHASSQALTFQQSNAINRALSDRVDVLRHRSQQSGMWAGLTGGSGEIAARGFAKANTHHYGGQLGLDHRLTPDSIVGVALSFSDASARFNRHGGKSDSTSAGLSLYGRQGGDIGSYVAGRIGHQWISTDVKRDVVVRDQSTRVKSDRTDHMTSVYGELGFVQPIDTLQATPFVGVSYDVLKRGAITESGSPFALKGNKKSYDQTAATLGLRLQSQPLSWAGVESVVTGYGAYRYGNAANLNYTAAFSGAPDAHFAVEGIGLQRHTGWLGLGVSTATTEHLSWNVNYDMQVGRGGINNNVFSAGLRYAFN